MSCARNIKPVVIARAAKAKYINSCLNFAITIPLNEAMPEMDRFSIWFSY